MGGKKLFTIQANEIQADVPVELDSSEVVGTQCRSMLFLHHGVRGTLYRTGEHTVVSDDNDPHLIQATAFFSVCVCDQYYTFVKGEKFVPPPDEPVHIYSSNPIVVPTSAEVVFPATRILRKVMLYPDPDNVDSPTFYVVVDFQRLEVPLEPKDVIVPVYPVVGDMVQVCGDTDDMHTCVQWMRRPKLARLTFMYKIRLVLGSMFGKPLVMQRWKKYFGIQSFSVLLVTGRECTGDRSRLYLILLSQHKEL